MRDANRPLADQHKSEEARFQFALDATATTRDRVFNATLVNLSRSGARIECQRELAVGASIAVVVTEWPRLRGKVVWSNDHSTGIKFDYAIPNWLFASLVREAVGIDRLDGAIYI